MSYIMRLFTTSCLVVAGAAILAVSAPPAGTAGDADASQSASTGAQLVPQFAQIQPVTNRGGDRAATVGPGHVEFSMSPSGRWLEFGVRGSRPLLGGGGLVVLARDGSGGVITLADTRGNDVRALPSMGGMGVVKEGARGGARYPSAQADDDGDGRVNEDCLDGVDNDGDGRIDEDYAAIGDEMIVVGCETSGDTAPNMNGQAASACTVALRQECYAWSLAHIDDMVALKLIARNTGEQPLEGLRIGVVFPRGDGVETSSHDVGGGEGDAFDRPLKARAMTFHDGDYPALAAVFAVEGATGPSWLTGISREDRSVADVVSAAERPDALARPDRRYGGSGVETDFVGPAENPPTGRYAYAISPVFGTIEPGAEAVAYVALVALESEDMTARVIDNAFRTIQGDEGHRMIPPPMSITRRNVWGSYRLRVPSEPSAGVTLTLFDPRGQNINPIEINQLEGIDLHKATRTEKPNGDVTFEITGALPAEIASTERVVLSGRTEGGEMFNAILRPTGLSGEATVESARVFWNTGGKLDEALLSGSPNPFHVATTISYEVPGLIVDEDGNEIQFNGVVETTVSVYNVAGRLVSKLVDTSHGPGRYQVQWTAQDGAGETVASGVYYVKLQIGKRFVTKRLTQLK